MTSVAGQSFERDALTGLPGRGHVQRYLDEHFQLAHHAGAALTVILADVDHLRALNDEYGRDAGDQVMRSLGGALAQGLRGRDLLGRWAGAQLIVVMPETEGRGAQAVAERLRRKAEGLAHPVAPGHTVSATLSVGWATMSSDPFTSPADLVNAAAQALSAAKAAGRNRTGSWTAVSSAAQR